MDPKRRQFLSRTAGAGVSVLLGTGVLGGRLAHQAYARGELRRELVDAALPELAVKASRELEDTPAACREEIRRWFHGTCLNVPAFVHTISCDGFIHQLRSCGNPQEKSRLLMLAFSRTVASHVEVNDRIRTITTEAAADLRRNWGACCETMAKKWGLSLWRRKSAITADEMLDLTEPFIRRGLEETQTLARAYSREPTLAEALGLASGATAEQAALLGMRACCVAPLVVVPLFLWNALTHLFDYITGQLERERGAFQLAVSQRMALLGNRIGSDLETEIRSRVADLHHWQEQAVRAAASHRAEELIPTFI